MEELYNQLLPRWPYWGKVDRREELQLGEGTARLNEFPGLTAMCNKAEGIE